mgnify:CR=1 FL=1
MKKQLFSPNFSLVIKGLEVSVNLQLGVVNEKIRAKNLALNVHVKEFDVSVDVRFCDN